MGLQTLDELLDQAVESTLKGIEEILRIEKNDNPDETMFWDSSMAKKNIALMKELKASLIIAEEQIETIIRRQDQLGF